MTDLSCREEWCFWCVDAFGPPLARDADTRGDWDTQRKHLKAAVEKNPDEPRYLLRYAVTHLKNDPDRFRELALRVVARFPTLIGDASRFADRSGDRRDLPQHVCAG